jgi:hypothetical protein
MIDWTCSSDEQEIHMWFWEIIWDDPFGNLRRMENNVKLYHKKKCCEHLRNHFRLLCLSVHVIETMGSVTRESLFVLHQRNWHILYFYAKYLLVLFLDHYTACCSLQCCLICVRVPHLFVLLKHYFITCVLLLNYCSNNCRKGEMAGEKIHEMNSMSVKLIKI